jgi:tetratricopeptide (TPR) repeat protein
LDHILNRAMCTIHRQRSIGGDFKKPLRPAAAFGRRLPEHRFHSSWKKWHEQIEAFVHNGRGFALAGLGESGPAMDEFELSIRLSPENAWVYHNRAQVHDRAGGREKACEDYQKALRMKNPALSPNRKAPAQARVRELSYRL